MNNIVDELVELSRLAYQANAFEAEPLIRTIATSAEEYKLGRVLSFELARLKCGKIEATVSESKEDKPKAVDLIMKVQDLEAEIEDLKSQLKEAIEEKNEIVGLFGGE